MCVCERERDHNHRDTINGRDEDERDGYHCWLIPYVNITAAMHTCIVERLQ